ncbi:MAG TPA: hypothetical protein VGK59_07070 [Ohtaekwangia sp.]
MKTINLFTVLILIVLASCKTETKQLTLKDELMGSWKLIYAVSIKKDTTIHNDPPGTTMIKILNDTHFAFMQHDVKQPGDTTTSAAGRIFGAGGGTYDLEGSSYTEHLEYCSARGYEGHDFNFNIEIKGDTLIQTGIEKLKDIGVGDENVQLVEKYIRIR